MMILMTATSTITVMTLENDYYNDDYDDGDDDLQVVKQSPPAPFVSLNSSSAPSGREREEEGVSRNTSLSITKYKVFLQQKYCELFLQVFQQLRCSNLTLTVNDIHSHLQLYLYLYLHLKNSIMISYAFALYLYL